MKEKLCIWWKTLKKKTFKLYTEDLQSRIWTTNVSNHQTTSRPNMNGYIEQINKFSVKKNENVHLMAFEAQIMISVSPMIEEIV